MLFENSFKISLWLLSSLPVAPGPFPAGPEESNGWQHVGRAADGRCVMGTAGWI